MNASLPNSVVYHEEQPVTVNGVTLAYDAFGDPAAPPLLLIAGLGMQLIGWDAEFCRLLAAAGFYVVRYDQRDVGHATRYDEAGLPDLLALYQAQLQGSAITVELPYVLADLADDAAALITALELSPAHVLGVSMGGMVAQLLAVRHPEQVHTLTCISSSTLDFDHAAPAPETVMDMFSPPPPGREGYIEHALVVNKFFHGSVLPYDAERARRRAAETYDRGLNPAGTMRQMAAILAGIGWKEDLPSLKMPVLVIHGDQDPLLYAAGGRDIAQAIPGARYVEIPGMGHSLPPVVWPVIVSEVARFL